MFDQREFEIRCEWAQDGLRELSADVIVLVDVLSFATAVEVATARGARVIPADGPPPAPRGQGYSLSPASLREVPSGMRLVLPSPNGSALALAALERGAVLAACLRNAGAAAQAAARIGRTVAVIPAGERWRGGGLRPCFEDWVGAGAVIAGLAGGKSPEARAAEAAFLAARAELPRLLRECGSGKELIGRGFAEDVEMAAQLDVSANVPRLIDGAFQGLTTSTS